MITLIFSEFFCEFKMDHTQHMEEISNIKNGIMELLDNMDKSIEFLQRETNLSKLNQGKYLILILSSI